MGSNGGITFAKVLRADTGGSSFQKAFENTHLGLAALVPTAAFQKQGSGFGRLIDLGMGVLIPIHSHVAMNSVLSDYIPKSAQGPARYATLASSAVIFLGLLKLNITGPGLTETVKDLWRKNK